MAPFTVLPMATQTAIAQLFQTVVQVDTHRSIAGLCGGFSHRMVRGHKYWYYQFNDAKGKNRQIFLGQERPEILALIEKKQDPQAKSQAQAISRLVRMAIAAGATRSSNQHFNLIRQLSNFGFFHAGGVLVGSHAFLAYANMLGIKWNHDTMTHTLDVDFAHAGHNVSVALPADLSIDTTSAIESLGEGFLPQIKTGGRGGTWEHPTDPDFLIDFLTPKTSESDAPFEHPGLGIALQPLRFMEFSLENVQQALVFGPSNALAVNVPDPARYALHKLIVYGERPTRNHVKAIKDLKQASALIAVLQQERPQDLLEAWEDLQSRGPGWRKRVNQGVTAMDAQARSENTGQPPFLDWIESQRAANRSVSLPAWRG